VQALLLHLLRLVVHQPLIPVTINFISQARDGLKEFAMNWLRRWLAARRKRRELWHFRRMRQKNVVFFRPKGELTPPDYRDFLGAFRKNHK
jgi:hypothetical protein